MNLKQAEQKKCKLIDIQAMSMLARNKMRLDGEGDDGTNSYYEKYFMSPRTVQKMNMPKGKRHEKTSLSVHKNDIYAISKNFSTQDKFEIKEDDCELTFGDYLQSDMLRPRSGSYNCKTKSRICDLSDYSDMANDNLSNQKENLEKACLESKDQSKTIHGTEEQNKRKKHLDWKIKDDDVLGKNSLVQNQDMRNVTLTDEDDFEKSYGSQILSDRAQISASSPAVKILKDFKNENKDILINKHDDEYCSNQDLKVTTEGSQKTPVFLEASENDESASDNVSSKSSDSMQSNVIDRQFSNEDEKVELANNFQQLSQPIQTFGNRVQVCVEYVDNPVQHIKKQYTQEFDPKLIDKHIIKKTHIRMKYARKMDSMKELFNKSMKMGRNSSFKLVKDAKGQCDIASLNYPGLMVNEQSHYFTQRGDSSSDKSQLMQSNCSLKRKSVCLRLSSKSNVQKYADLFDFVNSASEMAQAQSISDKHNKMSHAHHEQMANQEDIDKIKEFYRNFEDCES